MVASAEPPSLVKRRAGPRGLILAVSLALGFGIASFQDSASAAFDGSLQVKGRSATTAGAASSGAIVVADNKNWNKGKGDWNHDKNGNWDKNGYQNWSKYNGKNYGKGWSNYNNNWNKNWNKHAYVRGWNHRPYYGQFIAGVVLGSLLTAPGVGVVPYAPEPYLCWYWADPYMYRGYWDYCY